MVREEENSEKCLLPRFQDLQVVFSFFFLLRFYLFIFREKGREGEREGEKHQDVVASHMP